MNFVLSIIGYLFQPNSLTQIIFWQIADSMAIMACVLAGQYMASRSEGIASAGYVLFGIAYGISFGSSTIAGINEEIMATIVLPLVPALFLISFCRIYPLWVRIISLAVCIPFLLLYRNVIRGAYTFDDVTNIFAYNGIQLLGIIWAFFIYKNYKASIASEKSL